jgi:aarF domain-containing kinase
MIEAISHLVHRDYTRIGEDFQTLDFIPKGTDLTPIIPALSKVFDAALAGGGAKSINFQDLSADLAEITFKYPFRIPPYFALIIRAIGVLEGIALVGNPGFAIVDEAYPYISKRLLTDESPRLRAALKYMIYGKEGVFDVDRLIDLLQAFEALEAVNQYETVGLEGGRGGPTSPAAVLAQAGAGGSNSVRDALRFFFSQEGQFFRDFLLDETVKGVDAVSREGLRQVATSIGFKGPWVPPVLKAMIPRLNDNDKKVVENVQKLLGFFLGVGSADMLGAGAGGSSSGGNGPSLIPNFGFVSGLRGGGSSSSGNGLVGGALASALPGGFGGQQTREQLELARELAPVLRELAPQMRQYGLQVVGKLTDRVASRFLRFAREQLLGPERDGPAYRRS